VRRRRRGVVLLEVGLGRFIRRPWKGAVMFERHLERPQVTPIPTHPSKRLAHPRSPIPPLSTLTSRATHAHPTSARSTGFCAIWDCISSSSQGCLHGRRVFDLPGHGMEWARR